MSSELKITLIIVIAVILVLAIGFCLCLCLKKKKVKRPKVCEEFLDSLVNAFGGNKNIKEIAVDNARLKILVDDISLANLDKLKELSAQGVFITGNYIKILFKYDSVVIKKELEKRI